MYVVVRPTSPSDWVDIVSVALLNAVLEFGAATGLAQLAKYDKPTDKNPDRGGVAQVLSDVLNAKAAKLRLIYANSTTITN